MKQSLKKSLLSRLNRVEGQIRGLQKLVEQETYCIDVITQAQAVKSAIGAFEVLMLENHLETHVVDKIKHGKQKEAAEEIIKVYKLSQRKKMI